MVIATLSAAHRLHDFHAVARLEAMLSVLIARDDLLVDLNREPPLLQPFDIEQVKQRACFGDLSRLTVEQNVHDAYFLSSEDSAVLAAPKEKWRSTFSRPAAERRCHNAAS